MNRKEQLLKFLNMQPEDPFLHYALAQEYISEGNDAEAQKIFESLILTNPDYVATYYHFGKLLERGGFIEKAKETYLSGIHVGKKSADHHSVRELQSALNELEFEE